MTSTRNFTVVFQFSCLQISEIASSSVECSKVEQISHKREEPHNRYGPLSVQAPISDFPEMGDNATLGTNFDSDLGGTAPCDRHYRSLCFVLFLCKLVNAERQ